LRGEKKRVEDVRESSDGRTGRERGHALGVIVQ